MPRQGRMQSGTGVYHDMMRGIHFHLLLHAKDDTVGNIVKRIASSYVYYFNGKYGRTEKTITERVNESNTGALGLGGKTSVLATFAKIGLQRASGVRVVALRPCCCFEPRRAAVDL